MKKLKDFLEKKFWKFLKKNLKNWKKTEKNWKFFGKKVLKKKSLEKCFGKKFGKLPPYYSERSESELPREARRGRRPRRSLAREFGMLFFQMWLKKWGPSIRSIDPIHGNDPLLVRDSAVFEYFFYILWKFVIFHLFCGTIQLSSNPVFHERFHY